MLGLKISAWGVNSYFEKQWEAIERFEKQNDVMAAGICKYVSFGHAGCSKKQVFKANSDKVASFNYTILVRKIFRWSKVNTFLKFFPLK